MNTPARTARFDQDVAGFREEVRDLAASARVLAGGRSWEDAVALMFTALEVAPADKVRVLCAVALVELARRQEVP